MKSPDEIQLYLQMHWFADIREAHRFRNHLKDIFSTNKFTFKYPHMNKEGIQTINSQLITADEAINYLNDV